VSEIVRRMHQKDDAKEKDFIGKKRAAPAATEQVAKRLAAVRKVMYKR